MTKNERLYGVSGTIGNGEELINVRRREEPTQSYHLMNLTRGEEVAARYDLESIQDAYDTHWSRRFEGKTEEEAPREFFQIVVKPILREYV